MKHLQPVIKHVRMVLETEIPKDLCYNSYEKYQILVLNAKLEMYLKTLETMEREGLATDIKMLEFFFSELDKCIKDSITFKRI